MIKSSHTTRRIKAKLKFIVFAVVFSSSFFFSGFFLIGAFFSLVFSVSAATWKNCLAVVVSAAGNDLMVAIIFLSC